MRNLLICILLSVIPWVSVHADGFISATIITENGVIITDKLIIDDYIMKKGFQADIYVNGVPTNSRIPVKMVEEIIIEIADQVKRSGNYVYKLTGTFILDNEKKIHFEKQYDDKFFGDYSIKYQNPDPITGKLSNQGIKYSKVKSIKFKSVNGNLMIDSKGQVYPADYQYSPFTGEKLVPQ